MEFNAKYNLGERVYYKGEPGTVKSYHFKHVDPNAVKVYCTVEIPDDNFDDSIDTTKVMFANESELMSVEETEKQRIKDETRLNLMESVALLKRYCDESVTCKECPFSTEEFCLIAESFPCHREINEKGE